MPNQQLPAAALTTLTMTGADPPTSLNYPSYITSYSGWEIANSAGAIVAFSKRYNVADQLNGWVVGGYVITGGATAGTAIINSANITPPAGATIAAGYEFRTANSNGPPASAFFDVVPASAGASLRRNQTTVVVY